MKRKTTCRNAVINVLSKRKTPASLQEIVNRKEVRAWKDSSIRRTLTQLRSEGLVESESYRPMKYKLA